MKLKGFFYFIICLMSGFMLSDAYGQSRQADALEIQKSVFGFGNIPQGRPVFHVFSLKNVSDSAISIENVQASCGCTTPEWNKELVLSGENTAVKVGFNAASEGPFEKTIQVFYSGGKQLVLTIQGHVWKTPDQPAPPNKIIASLKAISIK